MQNVLNPVQQSVNNNRNLEKKSLLSNNLVLAVISITIVLLGVVAGYLLSGTDKKITSSLNNSSEGMMVVSKNEAGVADESIFSTTTDGVLTEGGIADEGTHHLVRGSGPSQYAYLTSSTVDLSSFVGKKVQIWGETISGKKAGWLIDVGKIKVIE